MKEWVRRYVSCVTMVMSGQEALCEGSQRFRIAAEEKETGSTRRRLEKNRVICGTTGTGSISKREELEWMEWWGDCDDGMEKGGWVDGIEWVDGIKIGADVDGWIFTSEDSSDTDEEIAVEESRSYTGSTSRTEDAISCVPITPCSISFISFDCVILWCVGLHSPSRKTNMGDVWFIFAITKPSSTITILLRRRELTDVNYSINRQCQPNDQKSEKYANGDNPTKGMRHSHHSWILHVNDLCHCPFSLPESCMKCSSVSFCAILIIIWIVTEWLSESLMCDRCGFSVEHFGMNEAAASKRNKTELSFEEYMAMNAIDNSEPTEKDEDTTVYVHSIGNMSALESYSEGVVYWNYHGGFANQMYSLYSSMIVAELKRVPFFCFLFFLFWCIDVDSGVDAAFIIKRRSGLPVISLSEEGLLPVLL